MPWRPHLHRLSPGLGLALVTGLAAVAFWRTAYPTITWWDSSQYSLAASTLGVAAPPGSLLLPLLGWPVTRLPFASPALALNLLAGAVAAITAALVYLGATQLLRTAGVAKVAGGGTEHGAALAGAALGALTVAFSDTLWEHAIKFTPYILTAAFTGLILWTLLRWWEEADDPRAWHRLLWLGLLFGLDFSVHRTNALLLPGVLAWILVRHPRTLRNPRVWLGGAGGMAAGLAVHLLIIPIAATTDSILNIGEPSNWARFWSYVSLEQLGGGFLVHFLPRNAPFWSAQVGDFVRVLGANFARWDGPLGALGVVPGVAAMVGLVHLWRCDRRLGAAFALLLFAQAALTVLYFNIPANFFRPLDRHYLPVCVTVGFAAAYGIGVLARDIARLAAHGRRVVPAIGGLLLLLGLAAQLAANWRPHDAARRYFARDFAANMLRGLPRNAVLFTNGDNDTFPLMYVQAVEGVRPDVQIVNRPLANTFWFVDQILRRDPAFPISLSREERLALRAREWSDTTLFVPVEGAAEPLGLAAGTPVPDTIALDAAPTAGDFVLPVDMVMLDILRTNRWRRPLCFSVTVDEAGMSWLRPYRRLDGLHWRIVPVTDPAVDLETLRRNLLETYTYRGYADPTVRIDPVSRNMGVLYQAPFLALIRELRERGAAAGLREATVEYLDALPCARLGPGACSSQLADGVGVP